MSFTAIRLWFCDRHGTRPWVHAAVCVALVLGISFVIALAYYRQERSNCLRLEDEIGRPTKWTSVGCAVLRSGEWEILDLHARRGRR